MIEEIQQADTESIEVENKRVCMELANLFGEEIVQQAALIDIAEINISDDMTSCISDGVIQLKKLKGKTESQRALIEKLSQGEKLVLCLWIMDMGLLDKLQA